MPDEDALERRLQAVERTLADGDHDLDALREAGEVHERVERLESTVADLRERVDDLDAATQALRGYVGNVRSVNRDVERRADAALAAVDRLETDGEATAPSGAGATTETPGRPGDVPPSDDRSGPTAPTNRAGPTDPDSRPRTGRDPDATAPTGRARERDSSGRPRECPYCSASSGDDADPRGDGVGRSDAPAATDGREGTDETEATGRPRGAGESTPDTRTPAAPQRREEPSETPATTRTDRDRDEAGTLDRIRDLLA